MQKFELILSEKCLKISWNSLLWHYFSGELAYFSVNTSAGTTLGKLFLLLRLKVGISNIPDPPFKFCSSSNLPLCVGNWKHPTTQKIKMRSKLNKHETRLGTLLCQNFMYIDLPAKMAPKWPPSFYGLFFMQFHSCWSSLWTCFFNLWSGPRLYPEGQAGRPESKAEP